MSCCETYINIAKEIEDKYKVKVYSLQYVCPKCGSMTATTAKTQKGVGFYKWSGIQIEKYKSENGNNE